jgi:uncharacterized protein (TIGR03083 family)
MQASCTAAHNEEIEMPPTLEAQRNALEGSRVRLAALVGGLSPDDIRSQAYPSEWKVADVLSHLGSGAVITKGRLDGDVDMQAVWDEWNAKDPDQQAADALVADAAFLDRLGRLTEEEAAALRFAMGPFDLDLITFLGLRLNEHVVHSWDVAVTFDPAATIPADAAASVVDALAMVAGFAGKPTGAARRYTVATTDPARVFTLELSADGITLSPADGGSSPDITLPSDAFIRLVYGRLSPEHTPDVDDPAGVLDELREAFPGF